MQPTLSRSSIPHRHEYPSQGKAELAGKLGHQTVSGELHKQVKRLIELGVIEMTIPDKPYSRLQKYRLTPKGTAILEKVRNG